MVNVHSATLSGRDQASPAVTELSISTTRTLAMITTIRTTSNNLPARVSARKMMLRSRSRHIGNERLLTACPPSTTEIARPPRRPEGQAVARCAAGSARKPSSIWPPRLWILASTAW